MLLKNKIQRKEIKLQYKDQTLLLSRQSGKTLTDFARLVGMEMTEVQEILERAFN
jgi:hypothetical protein